VQWNGRHGNLPRLFSFYILTSCTFGGGLSASSFFGFQENGYDPRKSKVSENTMMTWRSSQITGDLLEVPGIGPAAVRMLAESDEGVDKITNTYQVCI